MAFERARNEENKKIRLQQIKDAATKLFDEMNFHDISLSKIGKEINFTRGNLYKYISSKEDIYLYVLLDEMAALVEDLEFNLIKEETLDTKNLAYQWATILARHPRYLKLMSLLFMILERNSNLDTLIYFKNNLLPIQVRMLDAIKHNIPEFNQEDSSKLLELSMSLAIGKYPLCNPSEIQKEATELSNINYCFPNFIESYSEALVLLINGIKLSKM
ncbi:TetR/AcrR family transcriptional regulator [Vallitalea okinawensis]|uniref:TetR/AcrR family transcriptional regulator n=1 Tax=Vallitalea okinawensis TaxID=2078660 RepID=UPI000CFCEAFD|nr:TetR/AcrR family transcriptional regulator [Vallitalea okinawensis]